MNVDQSQLRFLSVAAATIPNEGPRAVGINLDFSLTTEFDLNMQNVQARDFISMIQSMFIDNKASGAPLTVAFPNTGQSITLAPGWQGYLSVLCPNPAIINFLSEGGVTCRVLLLNYPVASFAWPTS